MTAPLSMDLRTRVVQMVAAGHSAREAARRFAISPSAAIKLVARVKETGSAVPAQVGGHRRAILEPHADFLRELVTGSDLTLAEIREALAPRGVGHVALSTIHRMLHRLGLRLKKSPSGLPSRTGRMWLLTGAAGGPGSATWMPAPSSSSTRPSPRRT